VISLEFEKHTRDNGPQLLCNILYTRGGLGNNGFVIVVLIDHEMRPLRNGIGYGEISL